MPPNFEKVGSISVSAWLCVRPSIQKIFKARVLKYHMTSSSKKLTRILLPFLNYLSLRSYSPLFKDQNAIFNQDMSKTITVKVRCSMQLRRAIYHL